MGGKRMLTGNPTPGRMDPKSVLAVHQLQNRYLIQAVEEVLAFHAITELQSEIFVQVNPPNGWEALVAANNKLYVFVWENDLLTMHIEKYWGFYKNGMPRRNLNELRRINERRNSEISK